jgi:hypothetical protein
MDEGACADGGILLALHHHKCRSAPKLAISTAVPAYCALTGSRLRHVIRQVMEHDIDERNEHLQEEHARKRETSGERK